MLNDRRLSRAAEARLRALRYCTVIRAPWRDPGLVELNELVWASATSDYWRGDFRLTEAGEREAASLPPIPPEGAWLAAQANLRHKTMKPAIFQC